MTQKSDIVGVYFVNYYEVTKRAGFFPYRCLIAYVCYNCCYKFVNIGPKFRVSQRRKMYMGIIHVVILYNMQVVYHIIAVGRSIPRVGVTPARSSALGELMPTECCEFSGIKNYFLQCIETGETLHCITGYPGDLSEFAYETDQSENFMTTKSGWL